MGLVALDTLFLSYLLVELLKLLLGYPVLNWVSRIQKFYTRCLSFLLSQVRSIAMLLRIQVDLGSSATKESVSTRTEEDPFRLITIRDVEIVVERIDRLRSCEDMRWIMETMSADDMSSMFEEEEPSLEEVKEAFSTFDRNGDGFISAEELQRVLSNVGFSEGTTLDECRTMIGRYDENQDGRIDFHEFVKLMERSFC